MNKIIIYTPHVSEKHEALKLALQASYDVHIVSKKDLSRSILDILENNNMGNHDSVHFIDFELILFPSMKPEKINEISKLLNESNLSIERKAMITEHNIHWKLYDLLVEIDQEHQFFKLREQLIHLVNSAIQTPIETIDDQYVDVFQKRVLEAYDVIQNNVQDMTIINKAYTALIEIYGYAVLSKGVM